MKKIIFLTLIFFTINANANIIPIGNATNSFYYKIGGGNAFTLPPVSDTTTIRLKSNVNLGLGDSCSASNPALSITNSINDLRGSADNLEKSIVVNATGSLIQFPMYLLAQANPSAYHLLNEALLSAHHKLSMSTKSCEIVKAQISEGKNPYQDWGTIALDDQWKKHLSFISSGNEDINDTKKVLDAHGGEEGVPWVQGDTNLHAGGKSQPPVHVIADTVKAGYNAILNRDLQSNNNAPESELKRFFPNPKSAMLWITNVLGDQVITTCNDASCKNQQGSLVGHGLSTWVTVCQDNDDNCIDTLRKRLSELVVGNSTLSKENLTNVSADGIAISPDVIASIQGMDKTAQVMIIDKLSQEIAVQRVIDKAFTARHILLAGAEVPVIAANHPAQVIIQNAMKKLDSDIRSLVFESDIKKRTVSDTLYETLDYSRKEQQRIMRPAPITSSQPLMEGGAMPLS